MTLPDKEPEAAADWVIRGFLPNTSVSTPLTDEQTNMAKEELVTVIKAPSLNRRYIDPPINSQTFGLVSFIPAKDAVANEKGCFGYVKLRGNFATMEDCESTIDNIIRYVDSTNHIHVCKVGMPIPLVTSGFAETVTQVDVKADIEKDMSHNVRKKAMEERKEMKEIEEREEALKKDVVAPDPQEEYNAKRTKLAVLRWTLQEHYKKIEEIKKLRDKCISELIVESAENPDWEANHLERYMEARRKANIPEDQDLPTFMAFIRSPIVDPSES